MAALLLSGNSDGSRIHGYSAVHLFSSLLYSSLSLADQFQFLFFNYSEVFTSKWTFSTFTAGCTLNSEVLYLVKVFNSSENSIGVCMAKIVVRSNLFKLGMYPV